jgi:broad specificity phosphatase PhoE
VILLVRHGESEANAAGLLVGRSDVALTERGCARAREVGTRLGPVSRIVSSPLARARETAELLGTGLPVEVDERWRELDYGTYELAPLDQVPAGIWERWRTDPQFAPEGGESLAALQARIDPALDELLATPAATPTPSGGAVVVVSHVSPIKAAVGRVLDAGPLVAWRLRLATASITRLARDEHGSVLHGFNETG